MKHVQLVPTMGTVVSLDVRAIDRPEGFGEAVEAVTDRLRAMDDMFSPWRRHSWVSRLICGQVSPTDCPPEVQQVVGMAMDLMELTDGYFSPFWRRLPDGDPGPDPTGLVKGWAAQQVSDILLSHGMPDHVVNAAGDVVASGRAAPGHDALRGWHIGISDPGRAGVLAGVVELSHGSGRWAVATSGTAELGAHVSNPHTGAFPRAVVSATTATRLDVFPEGGAVADACATALVAAGDRAGELVRKLRVEGVDALLIGSDGSRYDPSSMLQPAPGEL
jgi:thiamine biosynthesis lipoprotein